MIRRRPRLTGPFAVPSEGVADDAHDDWRLSSVPWSLVGRRRRAQTPTPPPTHAAPPATDAAAAPAPRRPSADAAPTPAASARAVPGGREGRRSSTCSASCRESKLGKAGQEQMKALNDEAERRARRQEQGDPGAAGQDEDAAERRCRAGGHSAEERRARAADSARRSSCSRDAQVAGRTAERASCSTDFQAEGAADRRADPRRERASGSIFALGENSNIAAAHAGLDLSAEVVKRLDAASSSAGMPDRARSTTPRSSIRARRNRRPSVRIVCVDMRHPARPRAPVLPLSVGARRRRHATTSPAAASSPSRTSRSTKSSSRDISRARRSCRAC